jgi:hypothetical protein
MRSGLEILCWNRKWSVDRTGIEIRFPQVLNQTIEGWAVAAQLLHAL